MNPQTDPPSSTVDGLAVEPRKIKTDRGARNQAIVAVTPIPAPASFAGLSTPAVSSRAGAPRSAAFRNSGATSVTSEIVKIIVE